MHPDPAVFMAFVKGEWKSLNARQYIDHLFRKYSNTKDQLEESEEARKRAVETNVRLHTENDELRQQVQEVSDDLDAEVAESYTLRQQLAKLRFDLEQRPREIERLKEQVAAFQQDLETQRDENRRLQSIRAFVETQNQVLRDEIAKLKAKPKSAPYTVPHPLVATYGPSAAARLYHKPTDALRTENAELRRKLKAINDMAGEVA